MSPKPKADPPEKLADPSPARETTPDNGDSEIDSYHMPRPDRIRPPSIEPPPDRGSKKG